MSFFWPIPITAHNTMRAWDDECVVKQLAAARNKSNNSENKTKPNGNPIEFLLILVRKFSHKHYEFILIPGNCYDRVEQVYDNTLVELTHGSIEDREEKKEYGVATDGSSPHEESDDNNEKDEQEEKRNDCNYPFKINAFMESHFIGKAIFHTASGEPLMKVEASAGWKEAIKQKYVILDANSRRVVKKKKNDDNHTAAKAVAAAAIGGGAAAGATSVVAVTTAAAATTAAVEAGTAYGAGAFAASGGFGAAYGSAGYGAASGLGYYGAAGYGAGYGAGAGTWASWAAANGIATGGATSAGASGFGATASSTAAAGVLAPVGAIAAVGAVGGLGIYYVLYRRNRAKKVREQIIKEGVVSAEKLHEEDSTVVTEEESSCDGEVPQGYLPLSHDHLVADDVTDSFAARNLWLSLFAKRVNDEHNDNLCVFVPVVCSTRADAEREYEHAPSNNIAKALFDREGKVLQIEADPADHDGWETALALHYDFLEDHHVLSSQRYEEDSDEDAPLLEADKQASQKQNDATNNNQGTQTNWVVEAIRKKRQQLGNVRPGKLLNLRADRASA